MPGCAVLSTSPVAFPSHCLVFSATVPSPMGATVTGSCSQCCGVAMSPSTWSPRVPVDVLGMGAATEASSSGAVVPLLGAAVLPVVFLLLQIQSRSCVSEEEKQQARRNKNPKRHGARAIRKEK